MKKNVEKINSTAADAVAAAASHLKAIFLMTWQ